jgi:hypothetical protein
MEAVAYGRKKVRVAVKWDNNAVDRPVDGVESFFGYSPYFIMDYRPVSEFRGYGTKSCYDLWQESPLDRAGVER